MPKGDNNKKTGYETNRQASDFVANLQRENRTLERRLRDLETSEKGNYAYILLCEEQTLGTHGGDFTSGSWQTRVLNIERADDTNVCTLAANQFTLLRGTYQLSATAPANRTNQHQARLQNITDATTTELGTSEENIGGTVITTRSIIKAYFTITASKAFEIQHQANTTRLADGFGRAAGFDIEVYTIVEIWKIS